MGRAHVFCGALMVLVIGCAPKAAAPPVMSEPVAAPVPADAAVRLTAGDDGKAVTVAIGQRVSVAMVGVPTAGYVWAVKAKPAFLGEAQETSGDTTTAQRQPGFTGGNHWEVFTFAVQAGGKGILKLEQRRPWEPDSEPAAGTFTVTLQAQ
jgi:predicted secreted protein